MYLSTTRRSVIRSQLRQIKIALKFKRDNTGFISTHSIGDSSSLFQYKELRVMRIIIGIVHQGELVEKSKRKDCAYSGQ